ncbi:hypothetical protein [Polyangium jinanense]|uniref:Tetratricopeptide repeat protein n=1 Tax=Polyangium jinanense TaxID=2829994 RepID=A0A9X3X9W0_9BACT|nr:hypothetical protein [Polyangium jinanense]MDC3956765.1 hypothetical protein [Polyangium jinanense]MDC3984828.1 hypothetical protein [Polyangium jinanense]
MRPVSLLLAGIALCTVTARASADEPAGTRQADGSQAAAVQAARVEMEAGNFVTACPAFKVAYREEPRPSTLFWLATCYDKWGRIATAAVHYDEYLTAFEQLSDLEQKAERDNEEAASARRHALEAKIPKVILRVPRNAPATTRVLRKSLEGGPPLEVRIGVPLPIDPGEHVLTTEIPGRPSVFTKFRLKEGENQVIDVVMPPATETGEPTKTATALQPVPSRFPKLDSGISGRRVAAYTLGGLGAVGIAGGLVMGIITWAQKEPIEKNCLPTNPKICNTTGVGAKQTAAITGMMSNVALPVGVALLGTGIALYFTEPPPSNFGKLGPGTQVRVGLGPMSGSVEVQW